MSNSNTRKASFCTKCGERIPAGNRFCERCGAPVADIPNTRPNRPVPTGAGPADGFSGGRPQMPGGSPQQKDPSRNYRRVLFAAIAVIVVVGGCLGGFVYYQNHDADKIYTDKLVEARQLVEADRTDEAETIYLDLIDEQPAKQEAYVDLADLYLILDRPEDALDILEKGRARAKKTDQIEKKIEEAEQAQKGSGRATDKKNEAYKSAYREVLEENRYEILEYGDEENWGIDDATALCDLNEDGTPELLFFANKEGSEYGPYILHIYTYIDGKARECTYTRSQSNGSSDGDNVYRESYFCDAMAGGGNNGYIVFKGKNEKGFSIYSKWSDDGGGSTLSHYTMSGDGTIKEKEFLDYQYDVDYEHPSGGDYPIEEYYQINGKSVTEGDYNNAFEPIEDNMDQVIFYVNRGEGSSDDPSIWGKAKGMNALSMTYEEMIRELTVTDAGDSEESNGTDGSDVLKTLDGTEFLFTSGAGGWDTTITLKADGSFDGLYQDYNADEMYECTFHGRFSNVKKTGDHEYTMTLDGDIRTDREPGETGERDGKTVYYAEPYGLENLEDGDTILLLAPGCYIGDLDDDTLQWIYGETGEYAGETLTRYCLYNKEEGYLFSAKDGD